MLQYRHASCLRHPNVAVTESDPRLHVPTLSELYLNCAGFSSTTMATTCAA